MMPFQNSAAPDAIRGAAVARAGKTLRRWLYLTHRWIGIASCLLFAMWFISGVVMLYVPYPSLSAEDWLTGAEAIDWQAVTVPPPLADGPPKHLFLEMRDGIPVWLTEEWNGQYTLLPASAGIPLSPANASYAARVASRFGHARALRTERIGHDQWTVAGRYDRHRPLWKVDLDDASGTALYVSSSTGQIVQRTDHAARFWNWLGSVPHWIYPTILRKDAAAWRQAVLWVSGVCIAGAVTGLWIGLLRARFGRKRFKNGRMTPYRGWMLWHHIAGLSGGLFLLAWIFSGWLSVDPGHVFRGYTIPEPLLRRYAALAPVPPTDLQQMRSAGEKAKRVELIDYAGTPLLSFSWPDGQRQYRDAGTLAPRQPSEAAIVTAAAALVPDGHIVSAERLTAPDAYWYKVSALPKLPVLRLRFDDPAGTWLFIDPETGEILNTLDYRRRQYRWLYAMLHKWDLNTLTLHRPLWDGLIWFLSVLGLTTSVSGIWIGWRRLFPPSFMALAAKRLRQRSPEIAFSSFFG